MSRTYTLHLCGIHHAKKGVCYEQVPHVSGLLEEVLDGLVVFHSVKAKDVGRAIDYIGERYGKTLVSVQMEKYSESFCKLTEVCGVMVGGAR